MTRIIECDNLIKIHKQGNLEVVALQGLDFSMDKGEFISIVGKSGAGKSTLLQILAGLETPSAGSVEVAGTDLTDLTQKQRIDYYRRGVGFLWQDFTRNLIPYLKAVQNIELPMLLAGVPTCRAINTASPNTTRLTATPNQTVPYSPIAGSSTNAATTVPRTAPAVLIA